MSYDAIAELLALNEPDSRLVSRACRFGQICALLALMIVLTIPANWISPLHVPWLELPSFTLAHLSSVIFFVTLDLSALLLYQTRAVRLLPILWAIILVIYSIILIEYLTPGELPFAEYIRFLDPAENNSKISPNGALCMWFLCIGLWLTTRDSTLATRIGQASCLAAALISALALIGHAYTIESLYGVADYSALSLPGSMSYFLLFCGILFIHPEKGMMRLLVTRSAAGVMTRRLYGPVIVIPPLLGFFGLVSAELWKWYDLPFGIALFAISSILLLAIVVATTSVRLEQTDLSRAKAESELGSTIVALEASRRQLRELSAHIQEVQEDERLRISREVHDELGQSLTAIKMDVALLRNSLPASQLGTGSANSTEDGRPSVQHRMDSMLSLVNSTIHSVQRISAELRPSLLDDLGLAAAIEWQARQFEDRSQVRTTLNIEEVSLDRPRSIAIFRIFQETLTNIARHANATTASVRLYHADGSLVLLVQDNGVGFDANEKTDSPSLGLMGMRERAQLDGGTLLLESEPGKGTRVQLTMPLTPEPNHTT
ncbi:MAG: sensor histidine kinase [Bacteroidota bacterium]|nr:sensor histidine kinase [Bacteroidota bacterium]